MLDKLPDLILLDLIRQVPQLGLVNRKMLGLSELLTRNRLLSYYDYSDEQIDDLAADIRQHLRLESWAAVEYVANRDYWIFGPEHVKPYLQLSSSVYRIKGAPFGLQIGELGSVCLEYQTRLRAGQYQMFLDIFITQLPELSKTRFQIVHSPTVKQFFTSIPPYRWLEKQSACLSHMEMESTKLFIGAVDVQRSETSEWSDVTLRIESLDWSERSMGVVFNYLYFERHTSRSSFALDWVVQPPNILPNPTQALTTVYKRANERKRRWSSQLRATDSQAANEARSTTEVQAA